MKKSKKIAKKLAARQAAAQSNGPSQKHSARVPGSQNLRNQ